MKNLMYYGFTIVGIILGIFVGHLFATQVLPNMGANMITPSDIIGCYFVSVLFFGILFWLFGAYLADKI